MNKDWMVSISGGVFAIATLVGLSMLVDGAAVGTTNNAQAAEWLADSGNRTQALIGMYVMCAGAIAFVVFSASLIERLRASGTSSLALSVGQVAAVSVAVLTFAAAIGMASAAYAIKSDVESLPVDPAAVRVTTYGFGLWVFGAGLAAGTFMAAISLGSLQTGGLPKWLALIGLLLAVLSLFGIEFIPSLGILVWSALVAIMCAVKGLAPGGSRSPATALA